MIKSIRHTGIVVKNLAESLSFYRDLLGLKIAKKMEESGDYIDNMSALKGVAVTTIKLDAPDGQLIELLHFSSHPLQHQPREFHDIGIAHIAFSVNNLDETYRLLTESGVPFNAPPQRSPDGYAKVTFCQAPEGTFIELVEEL